MSKQLGIVFGVVIVLAVLVLNSYLVRNAKPQLTPSMTASTSVPSAPIPDPTIVTVRPLVDLATTTIKIGRSTIIAEIAKTDSELEIGLGGRSKLALGHGMLFVFPESGLYTFWMKDMKFPIDILWLDSAKNVVSVEPSLAPETYPNAYGPTKPVRYVLELPAGAAARNAITVGTKASFKVK